MSSKPQKEDVNNVLGANTIVEIKHAKKRNVLQRIIKKIKSIFKL